MGDRVVVMLDGRVQQVGTPKELYNKPTNRFVAGFIGSPAMNFVRAHLGPGGVASAGQDFELTLPGALRAKVEALHLNDVWVGIRPEHLKIQREAETVRTSSTDESKWLNRRVPRPSFNSAPGETTATSH